MGVVMNTKRAQISTTLRYLAVIPLIALGILSILATGGGGGSNNPPVADAGPDQTSGVLVGDVVLLDGSASSDPDGDALTYSWSLMVVPAGSTAELSDATAVDPNFVADEPGTYTAWLTVNDGGFIDSAVDEVSITVVVPPPKVTITTPENLSVVATTTVTVTGTVDDPNATLTVNGGATTNNNGNYTADVALAEGSNTVTVVARNGTGEGSASVEVIVNTSDNPVLSFRAPKSNFIVGFIVGEEFAMGVPFPAQIDACVVGGVKVNTTAFFPANNKPTVTVNSEPANVELDTLFFSGCGLFNPFQCWRFTATIPLAQGTRIISAVGTDQATPPRSTTLSIDGIVDYCRIGVFNAKESTPGKDPGVVALAGENHDIQSNRCHEIDGCSVPIVGSFANDPLPAAVCKVASTNFGEGTKPPQEYFVHGLQSAFDLPCNNHDVCYETCVRVDGLSDADREQAWETAWHACNSAMRDESRAVCRRAYPGVCQIPNILCALRGGCVAFLQEKAACFAAAEAYFAGIKTVNVGNPSGLERFKQRQTDYCAN